MIVTLLCTSRSGSTNLSKYLSGVLDLPNNLSPFMRGKHTLSELKKDNFYKIFIHNQTEGFNSLFLFGNEVIKNSDRVILYDRKNKIDQSESLAYRKKKYGDDLTKYHFKEYYEIGDQDNDLINECKFHFEEHSIALKQLSEHHNIPIFYYEDVYYGDGLKDISEYLNTPINTSLKEKYLSLSNKERLAEKTNYLI